MTEHPPSSTERPAPAPTNPYRPPVAALPPPVPDLAERVLRTLGCVLGGVVLGIVADVLAGDVPVNPDTVALALMFSPVTITFRFSRVAVPLLPGIVNALFGLAFWPGLAGIVWRTVRAGTSVDFWLTFLWTAQGFYQAVHLVWAIRPS